MRRTRVSRQGADALRRRYAAAVRSNGRKSGELVHFHRRLDREIDRREAAEEALTSSEAQYRVLLARARNMEDQLRRLTRSLLTSQEEERRRISRELHDALGQTLAGIHVHLAALLSGASAASKGLRGTITRTQKLVQRSMKTVHRFASDLRPMHLDDLGLVPALRALAMESDRRDGLRLRFLGAGGVDGTAGLGSLPATALYRVAQEALTNVRRHAGAQNVRVTLRRTPTTVRMEIWNDGKTFDVDRAQVGRGRRHLGLLCMRERVQMVGGAFSVQSLPGAGTTVRVEVPLAGNRRP